MSIAASGRKRAPGWLRSSLFQYGTSTRLSKCTSFRTFAERSSQYSLQVHGVAASSVHAALSSRRFPIFADQGQPHIEGEDEEQAANDTSSRITSALTKTFGSEKRLAGLNLPFYCLGAYSLLVIAAYKNLARQDIAFLVSSFRPTATVREIAAAASLSKFFKLEENSMFLEWLQNLQHSIDEEDIPFTSLHDIWPVTRMQRTMLRSGADSDFYIASFGWQLDPRLSDSRIDESLRILQKRHQIIRPTFVTHVDSGFTQVVFSTPSSRNIFSTGQSVSGIEKGLCVVRTLQRNHDLVSKSCPLRFDLITVESLCHVLIWSWHHTLSDGWSQGLFYQQLEALFDQLAHSVVDEA